MDGSNSSKVGERVFENSLGEDKEHDALTPSRSSLLSSENNRTLMANNNNEMFPDLVLLEEERDEDDCFLNLCTGIRPQTWNTLILVDGKYIDDYNEYPKAVTAIFLVLDGLKRKANGDQDEHLRRIILNPTTSKNFILLDLDLRKDLDGKQLPLFLPFVNPVVRQSKVSIAVNENCVGGLRAFCNWLYTKGKDIFKFEIWFDCELRIMRDFVPFMLQYMPNLACLELYPHYGKKSTPTTQLPCLDGNNAIGNLCPRLIQIHITVGYLLNGTVLKWISQLDCGKLKYIGFVPYLQRNKMIDTKIVKFYRENLQLSLYRINQDGYIETDSYRNADTKRILQSYIKFGFFPQGLKMECNKKPRVTK